MPVAVVSANQAIVDMVMLNYIPSNRNTDILRITDHYKPVSNIDDMKTKFTWKHYNAPYLCKQLIFMTGECCKGKKKHIDFRIDTARHCKYSIFSLQIAILQYISCETDFFFNVYIVHSLYFYLTRTRLKPPCMQVKCNQLIHHNQFWCKKYIQQTTVYEILLKYQITIIIIQSQEKPRISIKEYKVQENHFNIAF